MSTRIKYTDEPLGKIRVIPDFLPSPTDLAFREEGVKVTLALSRKSVEFFKAEAARHHTQYQRMIHRLLDAYVETQSHGQSDRASRPVRKRAARRREGPCDDAGVGCEMIKGVGSQFQDLITSSVS